MVAATQDPDDLEAEGHEDIARGNEKIAMALRLRRKTGAQTVEEWIPLYPKEELAGYGILGRRVIDAGKRGDLPVGKLGRTPAVRKSDLGAWIAARPVVVKVSPGASDADDFDQLVGAK
jgi:hypothetical protein